MDDHKLIDTKNESLVIYILYMGSLLFVLVAITGYINKVKKPMIAPSIVGEVELINQDEGD